MDTPVQQQNPSTSQPVPIPVGQQVAAPLPNQPVSSVSPTNVQPQAPSSSPKITLDDLYGPSGLADSNTPSVQQQMQPQSSLPIEPVPAQTMPLPVQPAPVSETPVPIATQTPQEILSDLPLRKKQPEQVEKPVTSPSVEKIPAVLEEPPSSNTPPPPKHMNTVMILRILFGAVGFVVLLVILMFVVTFLSSLHPSTSGKVTLTYWGLWEDSNTMQVAIDTFERQHPNITIQYEKEDPKDYSQRLLTRIQQGNGPDIFTYHSSWLSMVEPVLIPLPTSVITKEDLQNNFYPVVSRDLVKNGGLYGIPLEVDTLSLFVNNTLFQQAKAKVPTTWDDFTTTARALTQKDENGKIKIAGAAIGTFDNITHAPDILTALFVQNGVAISTMSPKSNASDALSFYTSFATGDSKVWDATLDPSLLAFNKGNLAMYFGYSWDVLTIKATNPTLDFSVYPIPHLPGRNTTAASYWVEGVSNKSLHQKEALLFMNFLAQKNTESMLYAEVAKTRVFGEPYARLDLGMTLKNNGLVYPFVEQATDALSSFFAGETQDTGLNGQMNGYLGNAVRSVLNSTSADTAIDTLSQGVSQVENQYATQ